MIRKIITHSNQTKMQQLPITVTIKNVFIEKIIHEVHEEIEEKGFSIVRVPRQKRLEFFYDFKKRTTVDSEVTGSTIVVFLFIMFILLYVFFLALEDGFFGAVFYVLTIGFFPLGLLYCENLNKTNFHKSKIKKDNFTKNMPGVKDKYIIITKKHAYLNNQILNFGENKIHINFFIEKYFTKNKTYYYKEDYNGELEKLYGELNRWNKTSQTITKLAEHLNLLELQSHAITKLEKNIKHELQKINEGSFDFSVVKDELPKLQKQIKKSLALMYNSKKLVTKLGKKIDLDYGLFQKFLNEKLIFSLRTMRHILKKHIFVIDYKKEETKKYEDKATILSNERLSIYKKELEKQVQILDRDIQKLESNTRLDPPQLQFAKNQLKLFH